MHGISSSSPLTRQYVPQDPVGLVAASSRRVATLNRLLVASWSRGWTPDPSLDADDLVVRARRATGLGDFGKNSMWRENLDVLTRALREEAGLSPLGRTVAHGQLVGILARRLRAQALWAAHPEILDRPITAPIIIVGQMRSGTTRMQRLLAQDRRLAHTRFFESWHPVPRNVSPRGALHLDDRRWHGWLGLACIRLLNPDFATIHPTSNTSPDEEIGLHSFSLFGSVFESQWRVPSYAAHCERMDTRPIYAEFRQLLQTLAWLRGGDDRPQILKVPQFTQDLAVVLETFPDARLLCLDRPMDKLIASSASLVRNQMVIQSDAVDLHWIGREWRRKISLRQERTAQARQAAADVPQLDLLFEAMDTDWRGEMERIYRFLDLPFDTATQGRMANYLDRSRRHRLDRHRYALSEFGLTVDAGGEVIPAA